MEKKYGNKYEVACAILEKLEQGGSGTGGKFTLVDGIKIGYSIFTEIPENFDFSEVTDFSYMFFNCTNLTSVPQQLNKPNNGTNFKSTFYGCEKLTSIPKINTSNGTNFDSMFSTCKNLKTIQQLDLSKGTTFKDTFYYCTALENISFVGSINYSIGFTGGVLSSQYARLTDESIKSILTACSKTTNTSSKTLSFKLPSSRVISDPNGELSALIGECTTKGWTITGLTLE